MEKKNRRYHHGDLKAAMIQAALELVRAKGARGFTLNEASRAAGVSFSAPYNHFKDKDQLLLEIVLLGSRTLETDLQAAAEIAGTVYEKLIAVFLAYIGFAEQNPELFAVMFQSGVDKGHCPEVQASAAAAFGIAAALAVHIEPDRAKAQELSLAVWTMAHGFATLAAEGAFTSVGGQSLSVSAEKLIHRLLSGQ